MKRKYMGALALLVAAVTVLIVSSLGAVDGSQRARAAVVKVATPTTGSTSTTITQRRNPTAPLTGIPVTDAALGDRPAVVVKVDNAPEARPQFGIDKADIVYEEKVEGGLSRYMAIFQSQDVNQVGPVRSLRSTDIYALRPLGGALMGFSGGIQPFKAMLPSSNLVEVSDDKFGNFYDRAPGRPYVHSLSTSTLRLRQVTPAGFPGPKPLFGYLDSGQSFATAGTVDITGISGHLGPPSQFDWTWAPASASWKRGSDGKPHVLVNGQISATNVIVQFVAYRSTPYKDPARNPVDEAVLDGTGDSWVLADGKLTPGRWVRPSLDLPTQYNDAAGQPIKLVPGNTWVELVPAGTLVEAHHP